jgi:hypothetical protein
MSCLVIEHNLIVANSNPNVPTTPLKTAIGTGVQIIGGAFDTVRANPGQEWPREIQEALLGCRAMLVIIGPYWLAARDPASGSQRLDDPGDWVRREVEGVLPARKWLSSRFSWTERPCQPTVICRRAFAR